MSGFRPRRGSVARAGIARHGRLPRSSAALAVVRFVSLGIAVLLVSGASLAAVAVTQLSNNIETVALVGQDHVQATAAPVLGSFEGGFNILIVGSDRCDDPAGCVDRESELNDVTMLLHVYENQTSVVAVSFPRDLVVPIPSCPMADGSGNHNAMSAQPINNTLAYGGLACTVLTVEKLTGLPIRYAGLISFNGVIEMSSAIGGVDVCINGPVVDRYSGLNLPKAGTYTLEGEQALQFLRTRHGVGDGSDLGRISSQQVFLSSLVRTIKSDATLTDLPKLFGLAQAATSNMQLSESLANMNTMVSMALVVKDIPLESITFVQYPATTGVGGVYSGKAAPIVGQAAALMEKLANDEPFTLDAGTGIGSVPDPNAPAAPVTPAAPVDPSASSGTEAAPPAVPAAPAVLAGVLGQTAADYTCSKAN